MHTLLAQAGPVDLTQWPILVAVVAIIGIALWAQRMLAKQQSTQLKEQLSLYLETSKALSAQAGGDNVIKAQPVPAPSAADGSGQWGAVPAPGVCGPSCRDDVLKAIESLTKRFDRLEAKLDAESKETRGALVRADRRAAAHHTRITLLERKDQQ